MVSGWRLVKIGLALTLSVGIGLLAITVTTVQEPETAGSLSMLVSVAGSFFVSYILLQRNPQIEERTLWLFGGLVLILFTFGNAVAARGIYAPMGEESPLLIGGLWLLSLTIAYAVVFKGGYNWAKQRIISG